MNTPPTLTADDFARAFGVKPDAIPSVFRGQITRSDFRYDHLTQAERDQVILGILKNGMAQQLPALSQCSIGYYKLF